MTQLEQVYSELFLDGNQSVVQGTTGNRDLLLACEKGELEDVIGHLDNGVDVNEAYSTGNSFWDDNHSYLMVAAMRGHSEIVKELCERGADHDARDIHGNTAFMLAIYDEQIDAAKELLRQGSDWTATNHRGETGLDFSDEEEREMMENFILDLAVEQELNNHSDID
jgi:ankyrin repeat protein